MHTIDDFLKYTKLTRYDIAKISGVSETTLADANRRPVNKMSVKVVQAIAMAVQLTPGQTLDELLKVRDNPIMHFIQAHPYMDQTLVNEVKEFLAVAPEKGFWVENLDIGGYGLPDSNERAEEALRNKLASLKNLLKEMEASKIKYNEDAH